jgi:hypothetical protein
MQLVAYGAQDVYLTGNPQITFFKVVYRRHTNFAMETIEETMSGNIGFGRRSSITIIRNGDLATNLYVKIAVGALTPYTGTTACWVRRLGHAILKSITISIGGSQIDKQYGTWMDIWYELTHTEEQTRGYAEMVGDTNEMTDLSSAGAPAYTLYVPLQFWFCRNTGLALPLIALQYHEVRIDFEFATLAELVCYTGSTLPTCAAGIDATLLVNYVYLDSEERRRFAQVGHEYLIEQVQFTGEESVQAGTGQTSSGKYKLGFNHPTKELIWAVKGGNYTAGNSFVAYAGNNSWTGYNGGLATAAQNLANAMFNIGPLAATRASTFVGETGNRYLPNTSATVTNVSADGTYGDISVTILTSDGVSYVPGTSGGVFTIGTSGTQSGTQQLYITGTGAAVPLSGISGNLTDVIVTVGLNAAQTSAVVQNVTVNAHNITLRDISIPISAQTDTRFSSSSSSQLVASDVIVNQHNNYGLLIDGTGNPVANALIQLNGQDRFDVEDGSYFNYVQPYQHHTRTPADGINVYSFALHPEQHQPSGSANLSRIDNTQLNLNFADSTFVTGLTSLTFFNSATLLYVFAFSYNVLRIMSGMGGLAYSN